MKNNIEKVHITIWLIKSIYTIAVYNAARYNEVNVQEMKV